MAVRQRGPFEEESDAPEPDMEPLVWKDRWGKCLDGRVFILAALVVDVEVALPDESNLPAAVSELSHAIQSELPHAVACLNIHVLPGLSQGGNKQVRLAMSGDAQLCAAWHERRQLQGSKYLGAGAIAYFRSLRDTSSAEHQQKMNELVSLHSNAETGFLLDLPRDWVRGWPQGAEALPLQAGSLWYDFAAVWGPVKEASMVRASDAAVVHLLLNFASNGQGAKDLFELLTDRYLYNPAATEQTYPVRCVLGHFQDLRLQALPEKLSSEGAPHTFELRRLRGEALKTPQVIRVTPLRRVRLGRGEDSADIALQLAHISKVHASLEVLGGKLYIQDTSVNGTWVNDRRVANGVRVELRPKDTVSFLPTFTRDAPTYEVQTSASRSRSTVDLLMDLEPGPGLQRPRSRAPRADRADQKKASASRHREHPQLLAEPVAAVASRKRGRDKVVHIDVAEEEMPVEANATVIASEDEAQEDVATWAKRLDNGSLVSYIPKLTSLFQSVAQIRSRYAGQQLHLSDFFAAVGVNDDDHRLAFATALRALSRHR